MEPQLLLLLSLATLLSLFTLTSTTAPPPNPQNNATDSICGSDYIRTSCKTTIYSRVCCSSLSPYANTIRTNPAELAKVSIQVSHSKVHVMTSFVTTLLQQVNNSIPTGQPIYRALSICGGLFSSAENDLLRSVKTMQHLGTGKKLESQMDYVRTQLSHAYLSQGTCPRKFNEIIKIDLPIKSDISHRTMKLTKYMFNAYVFVDNYIELYM